MFIGSCELLLFLVKFEYFYIVYVFGLLPIGVVRRRGPGDKTGVRRWRD